MNLRQPSTTAYLNWYCLRRSKTRATVKKQLSPPHFGQKLILVKAFVQPFLRVWIVFPDSQPFSAISAKIVLDVLFEFIACFQLSCHAVRFIVCYAWPSVIENLAAVWYGSRNYGERLAHKRALSIDLALVFFIYMGTTVYDQLKENNGLWFLDAHGEFWSNCLGREEFVFSVS